MPREWVEELAELAGFIERRQVEGMMSPFVNTES
jgi:hypothetical protein